MADRDRSQPPVEPSAAPAFTPSQHEELREALKDKYEQIVPVLERAVQVCRRSDFKGLQQEAKAHANAAEKFERSLRRFLEEVDSVSALGHEARSQESVVAVDDAPMGSTFGDVVYGRWWTLDRSRSLAETLLVQTRAWHIRAKLLAGKGRPINQTKRRLVEWIVIHMLLAGIRPTQYVSRSGNEKGPFARTVRVVYAAVGEPAPDNLFPDLHRAIEYVRKRLPDLFLDAGKPLQEGSSRNTT